MEQTIPDTMNIVDFKSNMDSLTTNLINEYMKLEKMYIQLKQSNHNELVNINDMNSSMTECLQSKSDEINSLQKELKGYSDREKEYIHVIDNQRDQIEKLKSKDSSEKGPETETNKFDMLRSQAKEISAKDKEIERLTKEIVRLKETNDMKKNISMVVKEEVDKEEVVKGDILGWSPTSSNNPTPSVNVLELEKDDNDDDNDDELFEISYRKKKYYRDNENKVYEIKEDAEPGPCIGNWVKQDNGKFKVVKS
jgi:hypothetical protein